MQWLLLATSFDRWLHPIEVRGLPSAEVCGSCHTEQHEQWSESGHSRAWTDPLYQAGFVAESHLWCANCHAPLPEMREEIARNLPWYAWQDPRTLKFGPPPTRAPEPRAQEGVTCVACHRADGGPPLAKEGSSAPHPLTQSAALTDGTLCKGCHEFPLPRWQRGAMHFSETPMQSTWSEWRRWREAGGQQSCVDCHLPGGDHRVRGVHDRDWLAASVMAEVTRDGTRVSFLVRSVGVGHALPSGDLFRRITLEVQGESWQTIATFGRRFDLVETSEGLTKVLAEDTSLQPGEARSVGADLAPGTRWRLRWHDGAEHDERRGLVDPESILVTLMEGAI